MWYAICNLRRKPKPSSVNDDVNGNDVTNEAWHSTFHALALFFLDALFCTATWNGKSYCALDHVNKIFHRWTRLIHERVICQWRVTGQEGQVSSYNLIKVKSCTKQIFQGDLAKMLKISQMQRRLNVTTIPCSPWIFPSLAVCCQKTLTFPCSIRKVWTNIVFRKLVMTLPN